MDGVEIDSEVMLLLLIYENVLFKWSDMMENDVKKILLEGESDDVWDVFVGRFEFYWLSMLLVDSFMDEREEWEKVW